MKIIIIEDAAQMGGVQHSTRYFLQGMKSFFPQHEVLLVLPEPGPFSEWAEQFGVQLKFLPKPALIPTAVSIKQDRFRIPNLWAIIKNRSLIRTYSLAIQKLLVEEKADIVLTKGMGAHLAAGRAAKQAKIPVVWHLQDLISPRFMGLYRRYFGKLAAKYADNIISDPEGLEQLPPAIKQNAVAVLNAVEVDEYLAPELRDETRQALGLNAQHYLIGHIARLIPWKGQHLLIQAFAKYAAKDPDARLILVGSALFNKDKYPQYLESLAAELGVADKVIMAGYRTDLAALFAAFDCYMYPSVEKDTCPLSIVAGISSGVPMALSDLPGPKRFFQESETLRFFQNRNTDEMATRMAELKGAAIKAKAQQNTAYARQIFSIEQYTHIILQTLLQHAKA